MLTCPHGPLALTLFLHAVRPQLGASSVQQPRPPHPTRSRVMAPGRWGLARRAAVASLALVSTLQAERQKVRLHSTLHLEHGGAQRLAWL